ncbi:acyl-CoA dehydrogenase [Nesterenkonia sp. E16_7]|uniref:acyl-CoA dehydrogenase n=1 Tax=unclassified Nesterenkonia TaxID=2629769 RepID=UPI001A913A48|nr:MULTISPECIES: acyl-CoA dehydrogenase [unclassified Nesterenkonia]MBO0596720.1 acyl-CoA dehydrogenase [Nesterenkonia sp. E16_10]MBO0597886.1 acyl-CoA dehydrogenase [Nesterenkonia sp. E16_7]
MTDLLHAVHEQLREPLPGLPGRGDTEARWRRLAGITAQNTVVGRLYEAHADAVAISTDLGRPELVSTGELWGVWAAEPPTPVLTATRSSAGWILSGTKAWCSGASMCSHALVTATVSPDSAGPVSADPASAVPGSAGPASAGPAERPPGAAAQKLLFAVNLSSPGVAPVPETWHAVGMAASDSGWVSFEQVPATALGTHADYLERAGFWHGGIGVAACWFGAARAVAAPLLSRAATPKASPLLRAHAGAAAAGLTAGWSLLSSVARAVDADPRNLPLAKAQAFAVRTYIDRLAAEIIDRTGRALGPGPLASDAIHAQRVADLSVYIRQCHAETDEAALPAVMAEHELGWEQLIGDGHDTW